jgi:hypothetical protein
MGCVHYKASLPMARSCTEQHNTDANIGLYLCPEWDSNDPVFELFKSTRALGDLATVISIKVT